MDPVTMNPRFSGGRRRLLELLGAAGALTAVGATGAADADSPAGTGRIGPTGPDHDDDDATRPHLFLNTRLTREYGVRYPFVSAGMGFVSYPPLVRAVCNAGGIGVLGNAVEPPPSLGVDAVIAEGRQAGGHNKSVVRTMPLLRRVIRAVKPLMVLAAGGIATGADVAEALASGADGVWEGTRMVASAEAFAHPEYKRRLLGAHGRATAVTTAFGPEYPNTPYRVLRTDLVRQVDGHEDESPPPQPGDTPIGQTTLFPFTLRAPYTMPPFSAIIPTPDTSGQFDLMGFPAGEDSVRKIEDVRPAAEIIEEMMAEAEEILRAER